MGRRSSQGAHEPEDKMSYSYEAEKPKLFTEEGQRTFLAIRDNAMRLMKISGAAMMEKLMIGTGDSWFLLACVDRLVEIDELREIKEDGRVAGQHRIFALSWRLANA
jgi:hypothetical protein